MDRRDLDRRAAQARPAALRRGLRTAHEHRSARGRDVLRPRERTRARPAGRGARPRDRRSAGRGRHRQGQTLRAGRADAGDPHRGCRRRQRHGPHPRLPSASGRGGALLRRLLPMAQRPARVRPRVPGPARGHHRQGRRAPPERRCPEAQPAVLVVVPGRGHQPGVHGATARRRLAVRVLHGGSGGPGPRRRQVLPTGTPTGHPRREVLVGHRLRQPDAVDARHPATVPTGRQPGLSHPGSGFGRGRHDHGALRTRPARRRAGGQLDPDHAGPGMVRGPAALSPLRPFFDKTWRPGEIEAVD